MQARVGIIGTGWVGSSVAISTLFSGVADTLYLHDIHRTLAEGEAMDLAHGAAFYPSCNIQVVDKVAMRQADVVVVAAGRGSHPGETRLDLLRDNARVITDIGHTLAGFPGIVVMVTNPVDVLTYVMTQASGLPPERVIGTGTMLDTARLRQMLGQHCGVSPQSVHADVVGEHGDSEVVLWSSAHIGGIPLHDWPGWHSSDAPTIAQQVRTAAYEIIQRKGATNHAIGLVTANLLRSLVRGEQRVLTVTRVHETTLGLPPVALSLPTLVGHQGAHQVLWPPMSAAERDALAQSANVLHQALGNLQS